MIEPIEQIQKRIIDSIQADTNLYDPSNVDPSKKGLTSVSSSAVWRLMTYIYAVACNLMENVVDAYQKSIETTISIGAPGTSLWFQDKVFKFQYDFLTPQIAEIDANFTVAYPTVDATKRIATRCSVKTDINKNVNIKVAKSEPPVAFSSLEVDALTSYINQQAPAGITPIIISLDADRLYVEGTIYYNGQYSATISADVIAAINAYLKALPFDGIVKVSGVEDAIQAVVGVTDVVLVNVGARQNTDALTTNNLVDNQAIVTRLWNTVAGYIVEEDTSGETFADKLTFTVG